MEYSKILQDIVEYSRSLLFHFILEYSKIFQNVKKISKVFQNIQKYSKIFENIVEYCGIIVHFDITVLWRIKQFFNLLFLVKTGLPVAYSLLLSKTCIHESVSAAPRLAVQCWPLTNTLFRRMKIGRVQQAGTQFEPLNNLNYHFWSKAMLISPFEIVYRQGIGNLALNC